MAHYDQDIRYLTTIVRLVDAPSTDDMASPNYAKIAIMNRTASHRQTALILTGFMFLLLSCNLGTSNRAPPTLAPLPTPTPQATLGYAEARPAVLPAIGATPLPPSDDAMRQLLDQVESDRLMSHIRSLQDLRTRHINSTQTSADEGIGAARRYINEQFEIFRAASGGTFYTFEVGFYAYTAPDERTSQYNIVGAISGTDLNAGAIIVGAHYDSIGTPRDSGTAYAPGANDNGSGVAAVLEMARIMSASQYKATIMFVLFSAEEVQRQGSIAFARWIADDNVHVTGMINLDTIGNIHDFNGNREDRYLRVYSEGPNDSSVSRRLAREANFLGHNYELAIDLQVMDAVDRENRYGDHQSFSDLGYPAIRFINAFEEKRNADPTDTIEFIEPNYLRRSTQAALALVTALAEGPRPPANIALREREGGKKELVWEPVEDAASYIIALRPAGSLIYADQLPIDETKVVWAGFSDYAAIAIAAHDARGLIGPLSQEIIPR